MTIREVEEQLGIPRANVRFYEKEGLLFPKRNPLNDYRDYSSGDICILERIIFLRNLGVSVEKIRQLENGDTGLREVMEEQLSELERQEKKTKDACLLCQKVLGEKERCFSDFVIPDKEELQRNVSFKDTRTELWMFWDKLVIWGFLLFQVLYTLIIFPMLPDQIPVDWQAGAAVEYRGRAYLFFCLALSVLCVYAVRTILYRYVQGGLRCYLDELNAIFTVGGIGVGLSMQVYTMLLLKGMRLSQSMFLLLCGLCYLLLVALAVLIYRGYKKGGQRWEN